MARRPLSDLQEQRLGERRERKADDQRDADADHLLDLAMDAEPRHRAMESHRNDDTLERERDQGGDEEIRPVLRPRRPGDSERERDRLRGEGIEHRGDALLVEEREARHQHRAGQQMGDFVGVVHSPAPPVRNASRMARKPKMKATPTKSGRRKTRILALLTSQMPSSAAPPSSFAVQASNPSSQPPTPAVAGAMPKGANRQISSDR